MTEEQTNEWHLDRKVTVSLIVSLLVQAAATVWWASQLSATVEQLRAVDARHESIILSLDTGRQANVGRITTLEAKGQSIEAKLIRIEDKIDRLIEAKGKP